MSALRALALMGSLAGGVTKGIESNEREAREKARDELQQLQIDGIKQERHDNEMLRGAGANVAIQDANAGPMPEGQQFRGAGRGFASMADVQTAEAQMNSPEAKGARRQAVLQEINPMQGLQEEDAALRMKSLRSTYMKQIQSEGVKDFLDVNFAGAPKVEDIEAGRAGAFDLAGLEDFNKVGKIKIPDGARGKWQALDLGNGRKVADFTVVDKDGKPLTAMSGRTLEALYGMSLKEREALADQRYSAGEKAKSDDREFKSLDRYRRSMADAAGMRAAGVGGGGGGAYERMPEAEKVKLQGIKGRIDSINDAITKARASNEFDEQSPNSKSLRAELAGLIDQQDAIVNRYSTSEAAAPIPGLKVGGGGKNVDGGQGRSPKEDTELILRSELADAIQRRDAAAQGTPEWKRAQADVESVNEELRRAGANPQPSTRAAPSRAPGPAQRPAVSMAQAAPKSAGQALVDQVMQPHIAALKQMAAGVKQAEQQLAAAAKSGDPKAVAAYAQALQAARSQLKTEADKRLGNNAPAFLSSIQ